MEGTAMELSERDVLEDPVCVIRDELADILSEARGVSGLLGSLADTAQRSVPSEETYMVLSEVADRIASRAERAGEQVNRLSPTWAAE